MRSDRGPEPEAARRAARWLALVAGALALMCLGLALAWNAKRQEADCWRAAFEDDALPPEGSCG